MAVDFLQTKKRQKYLPLILALIILAILIIIWQGFLKTPQVEPVLNPTLLISEKININWSVLKDSKLTEFNLFEEIKPFDGERGRENPFISY